MTKILCHFLDCCLYFLTLRFAIVLCYWFFFSFVVLLLLLLFCSETKNKASVTSYLTMLCPAILLQVSEAIIEEEDEQATVERNLDEIDDQMWVDLSSVEFLFLVWTSLFFLYFYIFVFLCFCFVLGYLFVFTSVHGKISILRSNATLSLACVCVLGVVGEGGGGGEGGMVNVCVHVCVFSCVSVFLCICVSLSVHACACLCVVCVHAHVSTDMGFFRQSVDFHQLWGLTCHFFRSVQILWENYRIYLTCERFSESNFANLPRASISFLHGTFLNGVNLFCLGHHQSVHGLTESTTKGSSPIVTCKSAI